MMPEHGLKPSAPENTCIEAWEKALIDYEQKYKKRANDALPKRMRLLLQKTQGIPFSELDPHNENLSRELRKAQKIDMLKIKKIFPDLPLLEI